jgi:hypothetical protein
MSPYLDPTLEALIGARDRGAAAEVVTPQIRSGVTNVRFLIEWMTTLKPIDDCRTGGGPTRLETKVILSSHDFEGTPDDDALRRTVSTMWASGADIAKVATTARDVSDARRMFTLLEEQSGAKL